MVMTWWRWGAGQIFCLDAWFRRGTLGFRRRGRVGEELEDKVVLEKIQDCRESDLSQSHIECEENSDPLTLAPFFISALSPNPDKVLLFIA